MNHYPLGPGGVPSPTGIAGPGSLAASASPDPNLIALACSVAHVIR